MIDVVISQEPLGTLASYAEVPIAFEVRAVLEVAEGGLGGFALSERELAEPWRKDYDAEEANSPAQWAERFDMRNWALFAAHVEGRRVGGAAVAFDTPGLFMLEERRDLAVLWDVRVDPQLRGRGVGSALFAAVEGWARGKGCRHLKVETQTVNVPACRFYARQGCALGAINRFAYPELPGEVQVIWYKDLGF
jgi:GNAT superfamily N-acetyltransferase